MGCIRVEKITEYLCEPLSRCLKDEVNDCLSACLFVSLSLSVCLFVSLSLSFCLFIRISVSVCPFIRISVSVCLSVCLLVSLRLCVSASLSVSVWRSVCLSVYCLFACIILSVCLSSRYRNFEDVEKDLHLLYHTVR